MKSIIAFLLLCSMAAGQDLYADLKADAPPPVEIDATDFATPQGVVDAILRAQDPQSNETYVDLGSGDGRVVIAAAKDYGCRAYGIEKNPERVELARRNVKAAGVEHLVTFIEGDFTEIEWPDADVGFAYLFPDTLREIREKLLSLDRFATFAHQVPGLNMYHGAGPWFEWRYDDAYVMWNDKPERHPHCNSPNCSMDNYIRAGLAEQRSPRRAALAQRQPARQEPQYRWVRYCDGRRCWWEKVRVN